MAKLGLGGFGHHPSGQAYAYILPDTARRNQNFVAPVKCKSGSLYNTMFTPTRMADLNSTFAQHQLEILKAKGIQIKSVDGRDVMNDLPTGRLIKNYGNLLGVDQSAAGWARSSKEIYDNKVAARLGKYGGSGGDMMQKATSRLLGGVT